MEVVTEEAQAETNVSLTDETTSTDADKSSDEILQEQLAKAGEDEEVTPSETKEIEVDGKVYDLPTLQELLSDAENVREKNAAAEQKFQEAAELRRQTDAEKQEMADLRNLHESWKSGDPKAQALILEFLQAETAPAVQTGQVETPGWDEFTPREQFLYKMILDTQQENRTLKQAVVPALEDVKGFVGSTRAEREAIAQSEQIKAAHGIDMTPAQLKEMKDNLSDPVKAIAYMKTLVKDATVKATEVANGKPKPVDMPAQSGNVFDPGDLSADEIIANILKGRSPIKK